MRARVLLLLLVALVLGAALVALRRGEGEDRTAGGGTAVTRVDADAAGSSGGPDAELAVPATATLDDALRDHARVPAATVLATPTGDRLTLRVLTATGEVARDAEITIDWLDEDSVTREPPRPTGPVAVPVRQIGARGVARRDHGTTGPEGLAIVPWRSADFLTSIAAADGSASILTAARSVRRDEEGERQLEVRLLPASTLRVQVVDADRRPVQGHEVRLITSPSTKRTVRAWARTDAEGRARFDGWSSLVTAQRAVIVADWPTLDSLTHAPYAQEVDPLSPPEVEIVLQLGSTGRLRAIWEGGPSATERGEITFTANSMGGYGKHLPTVRGLDRGVFERLPLGQTWTVDARSEAGHVARAEVIGPRREGETIDVVLEPEAVERTVARLVGPGRRPLGRARVTVTSLSTRQLEGRTDADGRIEFMTPAGRLASPRGVHWRATLPDGRVFGGLRRDAAPRSGTDGADLGDVALVRARRLVAAKLVDESGVPLALTDVLVLAATKERRSRVEYDGGIWGIHWTARTDEDGLLNLVDVLDERELPDSSDTLTLRVRVQRDDFDPWHVFGDERIGSEGTTIVAQRPGRLNWRVSPMDALEDEDVRWRLVARDGATTPFRQPRRTDGGRFGLESVMPGRFDLVALSKGSGERELARLEDVRIVSGQTTEVLVTVTGAR